jgi:hypothetical protein
MKTKLVAALALGIFLNAPIFAGTLVQVMPVSSSGSGSGFGYVSQVLVTGIQPFDATLGTLTSFEFTWALTLTGSATNDGQGLEAIIGRLNGAAYVSSASWGGGNFSGSAGSGEAGPLSFSFDANVDGLFLVSGAGSTYNPSILNIVTGPDPYPADWGFYTMTTNFPPYIPWTGAVNGNFTVTYNYDAPPAPEPSTFALMSTVALAGIALLRRRRA